MPDDDQPTPKPPRNPKGIYCPSCRGVRFTVVTTRRPCPGLTVRYRRCTACGTKITTEDRIRTPKEKKT